MTSYKEALISIIHSSNNRCFNGQFEHRVTLNNLDGTSAPNCKIYAPYNTLFRGVKVCIRETDKKRYIIDNKCDPDDTYSLEFILDLCSEWLSYNKSYNIHRPIEEKNDFTIKIKQLLAKYKLTDIIDQIINNDTINITSLDDFNAIYNKSYEYTKATETIKLLVYILHEYTQDESYHLYSGYDRRDLLRCMIDKPKFEFTLFIYNTFKEVFGVTGCENISKLPDLVIKLIKINKHRNKCKELYNAVCLFKTVYRVKGKNKYEDDDEDDDDIYTAGKYVVEGGYCEQLEQYLYENNDDEEEQKSNKFSVNLYNKDHLYVDNENIIKFKDDLIYWLPHIVNYPGLYSYTNDIQLINQLITTFDNPNQFYSKCLVMNIVYLLTGYKDYKSNKLASSTIPKYFCNRRSERWKAYFDDRDTGFKKCDLINYISKSELYKQVKGIFRNFSDTTAKCEKINNQWVWTEEENKYCLSQQALEYLRNITDKKINKIIVKLTKEGFLTTFNENIYVAEVFKSLNKCVEFFYNRINDDEIDLLESQYYEPAGSFKTKQQEAVTNISASSTSIVRGFPGTGKTDILISEICSNNTKTDDVWVLTPTGKATSNIIGKCSEHSVCDQLQPNNRESKLIISTMASVKCKIKYIPTFTKQLGNITLYIDEAGMIGCHQFSQFLETLSHNDIIIKKIVLFGDTNQLPPVRDKCKTSILQEYINVINTEFYSDIKQDFNNIPNLSTLDEIVRSDNQEMCEMFKDISTGDTKRLRKLIQEDNVIKCISQYNFKKLEKDIYKEPVPLILTLKNDTVNKLNKTFQSIHHGGIRKKDCYKAHNSDWEFKKNNYLEGDKVMNLKNIKVEYDKDIEGHPLTELLSNGEIGEVLEVRFDDENNKIVKVSYKSLKNIAAHEHYDNLRHAYAVTVHKSQGGEANTVVFVDSYGDSRRDSARNSGRDSGRDSARDSDSTWGSSREVIYTGLTRAKNNIIIVSNNINNFYKVLENKETPPIKSGFTDIFISKFDICDEGSSDIEITSN